MSTSRRQVDPGSNLKLAPEPVQPFTEPEHESRLRRVLQGSQDGYFERVDLSSSELWWSPRLFEMLGYADREFVPTIERLLEMIHPDDRVRVAARSRDFSDLGSYCDEYRIQTKNSEYRWFQARGSVLRDERGEPVCVSGTLRDVTAHHAQTEKLRQSEQLFRNMFDYAAIAIALTDLTGRFIRVNDAACKIIGYSREDLLEKTYSDITAPEDLEISEQHFGELVRGDTEHYTLEKRYIHKSGRMVWGNVTVSVVRDLENNPLYTVAQLEDVTERKRAEQSLVASEQWFRSLIELSATMFAVLDAGGVVRYLSPSVTQVLGFESDELMGKVTFDFLHPDDVASTHQIFQQVLESPGNQAAVELRHLHKDGSYRWLRCVGINHIENPAVNGVLVGSHDITESKHVQEALLKSEDRYRSLFDNSPVPLWEEDFSLVKQYVENLQEDGVVDFRDYLQRHPECVVEAARCIRITDVNQAAIKLNEADSKEQLQQALLPLFTDAAYQAIQEQMIAIAHGVTEIEMEVPARTLKGRDIDVAIQWHVVPGYERSLERVHVSSLDITQQKQDRLRLQDSEARFRHIFHQHKSFMCLLSLDGIVLEISTERLQVGGYSREDFIGKPFWENSAIIDNSELQALAKNRIANVLESGEDDWLESTYQLPSGEIRCFESVFSLVRNDDGEVIYILFQTQDITERKRTEEKIATGKQILEQAESIARAGSWEWRLDQDFATWSKPMKDVFGIARESVSLAEIRSLVHPDDLSAWEERASKSQVGLEEQKDEQVNLDYRIIRPDNGSVAWIHSVAKIIRGDEATPAKMIGMSQDVTEQRAAERALQESEAKFRSLFNESPIAIQLYDQEGVLVDVNQHTLDLFGIQDKQQIIGYTIWDTPDSVLRFTPEMIDKIKSGQSVYIEAEIDLGAMEELELFETSKSGKLQVDIYIFPMVSADQITGFTVQLVDVTERRKMEAQLRHSQKMESIGRLAGGIAHDFNNILVPIVCYADLAMLELAEDDPAREHLVGIQEAADRAASLVRQILAFGRKQWLQRRVLDLNEVVSEFGGMIRRLISEEIFLEITCESNLPSVDVDPTQIVQVLMNLAINARDAMPHGGSLTIETARVEFQRETLENYGGQIEPGEYVSLTVTDTGTGMDAKTRQRIFEPFFTTKPVGEGTGLGLSTSFGIIKQHGGYIRVDSEPSKGTMFRVFFPAVESTEEAKEPLLPGSSPLSGSATVLLVEDDKSVRELASRTLNEFGYEVLEARTPAEAIEIATQRKDTIDLLLADLIMPGISGIKLHEEISAIAPNIKCLFMSGYVTQRPGLHDFPDSKHLLRKPFGMHTLGSMVKKTLT